jgi:hypothetical protein
MFFLKKKGKERVKLIHSSLLFLKKKKKRNLLFSIKY